MTGTRFVMVPLITLAFAAVFPAAGQSVVSTRSGTIYFFEGAVFNGDQRLEQKFGKFPEIPEGGEFRTEEGRAEVLLTPGVFLRMDHNTAVRMVSNRLSDTRVQLLHGSVIIESNEEAPDTSVKLIYQRWQVRVPHDAVYRMDTQPAQVRVYKGDIEVAADGGTEPAAVKEGEILPLADVLITEQSALSDDDAFQNWAISRSRAVSADDATAAEIFDDPSDIDGSGLALGGFTYFPMTGIPSLGISNPYGASFWSPSQPALNPIYAPGSLYGVYGLHVMGWPGRPPLYTRPIGLPPSRIGVGLHPSGIGTPRFGVTPAPIGPARGMPRMRGFHGGRR